MTKNMRKVKRLLATKQDLEIAQKYKTSFFRLTDGDIKKMYNKEKRERKCSLLLS